MLEENAIEYRYRDYTQEPLSRTELKKVFQLLGKKPAELLRKNDKAYKELGLTGEESNAKLIAHMAEHPILIERPIAIRGERAVVGRPPENVLDLV